MLTLVLDRVYQPVGFVKLRKLIKLVVKDKVDIISIWDEYDFYDTQKYPATVRLRDYVRKRPFPPKFNRLAVFKRDRFVCQYTGQKFHKSKLTIDHIVPRSHGGKSTWENCVTASIEANSKKKNRTPEQAGMALLSKPYVPANGLHIEYAVLRKKHPDWGDYFPKSE